MNFARYLKTNAQKVDQELDQILSKLPPLTKEFVNSCEGGKRIRGVLVKLGYELGKGKEIKEIFKIGAALEIMHTAILVHDDIMDKSPTRRGKPSLYACVGQDLAIALADYGFFLSLQIISETSFPDKEKTEALKLFSQVMVDTAIGQIMDIQKENPMLVAKLKTAQYTIVGPLCLGAILAHADQMLGVLREFGENLGIAFQIKDDILDGERDFEDQALVLKYTSRAKQMIPRMTKDSRIKKLLESMTEYLMERKS